MEPIAEVSATADPERPANKIDDKKIEIDLDLIYELDHWKNDSKIHINYEIRHFGMQSVKIIN